MDNGKYHTQKVKRVCENKLKINFNKKTGNKGPHYTGWFLYNGKKKQRITVPKGKKPIPKKTYKTMAHQLGIDVENFDNLLACPLTYE